jgi:hypothetical protein
MLSLQVYTVNGRTRRVFRLTHSFVWFREEDNGLTHERVITRSLFEKWLRGGFKNAA